MIKIFSPLASCSLIYIDDILLYSSTREEHLQQLQEFAQLVQTYGIMLSEKKTLLLQDSITFLGMQFEDGHYKPIPHIGQELLKFPDCPLTIKQIQQFLGIVNYLREFVPNISVFTAPLEAQLRKSALPWSHAQTVAVKHLKQCIQDLPPLQIPSNGKRILQIDASTEFWGAVLLEEDPVTSIRRICGYASGKFSTVEHHYHSTFKEILTVQQAIKKY